MNATSAHDDHVKGCAMKVHDMEVILKVRVESVYEHEADAKKVEELIEEFGMVICRNPKVLFTKIIDDEGKMK